MISLKNRKKMQNNEQSHETPIKHTNFWESRRNGAERIFISRNNSPNSSNLMRKLMYTPKKLKNLHTKKLKYKEGEFNEIQT